MRWAVACAIIGLTGCGWQPAGNVVTNTNAALVSAVTVGVGQSVTFALPALRAGDIRSAASTSPTIATATIDAQSNLVIGGIAPGVATITQSDTIGQTVVRIKTYSVTVTP